MHLIRTVSKRISVFFALSAGALGLAGPSAAQNFAQPRVVATGNWPVAVYSADVNNDGRPDLLYLDQGATPVVSTTHILLNDGKGNFTPSATLETAGDSIAIGDLTGQGHVDVGWLTVTNAAVAGQYTTTLTIAPGRGDGTFSANVSQSFLAAPALPYEFHFLQAGRLHPTGPLDVLAGDVKTGVVLDILHTSSGAQASSVQIVQPPDGVGPMTLVDLNGDGVCDLVVNSASAHTAQVMLAFSGGGFAMGGVDHGPPGFRRSSGISGIYSLAIQDVNLDGRPDLIAEGANGHIDVFFGNGDGTFQSVSSGGTGPLDGITGNGGHLITVADLNHDGLPDAMTATPAGVATLLGDGTAYLGLKGIYNAGPGRRSYTTADFDGDGNLDLAVDSPEGVALLFGHADGSLQTSRTFAAGQPALAGALGAFNASGTLDAVVSTAAKQAQLLRGAGNGTFQYAGAPGAPVPTSFQPAAPGLWSTVQVGDLDGDGKLDLLLTADGSAAALPQTPDGAVVQLGDGAGGFAAPLPLAAATLLSCPQAPGLLYGASTLARGTAGAAIVNRSFDGGRYYFNGNGSLPQRAVHDTVSNASAACGPFAHNLVIAAPFVAAGVPDVIVQANGSLLLYPSSPSGAPLAQASGDLSIDGSLTTPGQRTAPQLSATFPGPAIPIAAGGLGFPAFIGSAVVADLDGDGHNDLVVTYANLSANLGAPAPGKPNYIYLWYGSGGGRFLTSIAHPVNPVRLTPSRNFYQAALADLNADGVPDLILSDGYILSVQTGKGDGSFGPEIHFLAGQGINSISAGDVDGDGRLDLVLANGGEVLANPVANLDSPAANAEVNTGGITVLLNPAPPPRAATRGTVAASPEPSSSGFTLTANLSAAPGLAAPTGSVDFTIDGTAAGTAALAGGVATLNLAPGVYAALAAGTHPLGGAYSGDAVYAAASLFGTHVVQPALALTLSASPEPSTFGASFLLTATLSGAASGAGTFQFTVDGTVLGSITNTTGLASITGPSTLAVGSHALGVSWVATAGSPTLQATATHLVLVNPTSIHLLLCVDAPLSNFPCGNPLNNTPLLSPVTMYFGQVLDGTAIESSVSLTGNIRFLANNAVFCTISANLQAGGNACPPTSGDFQAGLFAVQATYSGDANNAPAQSNPIQVRVFPDLTTAAVTASVPTAVIGTPITFTGKIAGNFAVPGGPVQFLDGTTLIGTGTLNSAGIAGFTTSSLALGTHTVSIEYAGNANFLPALSAGVIVVITATPAAPPAGPQSFTLSVTPAPMTLGVGRTGILQVTVTAVNGFSQPVALSCAGLPNEAGCTFVNATIAPGGGSTTLQLTTAAPHTCGETSKPYFLGNNRNPATARTLWAGLMLFAAGLFRARRGSRRTGLLMLLAGALVGVSMISGCGNCTDLGTKPGSYTFSVLANAQGGPVSESAARIIPVTMTLE